MNRGSGGQIARLILDGFSDYRTRFTDITRGAHQRFLVADWPAVQQAAFERINLYDQCILQVIGQLDGLSADTAQWQAARQAYIDLISYRTDPELAETFYNSVYRKLFSGHSSQTVAPFTCSEFDGFTVCSPRGIYRSYSLEGGLSGLLESLLDAFSLGLPWENRQRDSRHIRLALQDRWPALVGLVGSRIDMLKGVFYRNKGAYLVGRIVSDGQLWPLVLPVLNNGRGGLYVDTLLCDPDDISILFSFTRAYFMVDARNPSETVDFLHGLLPGKARWEIYTAIGFFKHGKTLFYRDLLAHLARSQDQMVMAPGVRGLVMIVFTLDSLGCVFKVIKDRCDRPKEVTPQRVKNRYQLVKTHDRVGRMADTQEFVNLSLPRARFSDALLQILLAEAGSAVVLSEDQVLIRHLYCERRMVPLNIHIGQVQGPALRAVLDEYGNAIRQLAAANIFPGDLLPKNFGVTRHGRVVFYDYDEIVYLTECHFRAIPQPVYPEQELAAEPWYSVAVNDVFPEEFPVFLFPDPRVRQLFIQLHGELFSPDYWRSLQQAIVRGEVMDVFPYRRSRRFVRAQPVHGLV